MFERIRRWFVDNFFPKPGSPLNRVPVPYSEGPSLFERQADVPAGMTMNLKAMGAQSTLFAIVDRLASSVAAVEWKLYTKTEDPSRRVERIRHPALVVWRKPNQFYTGREFRETIQQHHDLAGEYWWVVSYSSRGGVPLELWPVRPDRMEPVPSKTDFIAGYLYHAGRGREIPLRTDQVIFNKRPNPTNPYRGIGPVGTLLMDIEGEAAASAYNTNFFRNSAEPGGLIKIDRRLADEEFAELVERWNQQHRGVANAHRVGVLEQAEWVERRYTQRDMQFEQLRRFSRETFRQAFGFPKPLLGDVEDVNRANAEAADVVFAKYLLKPRLDRIRESLNDDFLPLFGSLGANVEFDYVDPTPPDLAEIRLEERQQVELAIALIDTINADPAEVFDYFGLPEFTIEEPVVPPQLDPFSTNGDNDANDEALARLGSYIFNKQ